MNHLLSRERDDRKVSVVFDGLSYEFIISLDESYIKAPNTRSLEPFFSFNFSCCILHTEYISILESIRSAIRHTLYGSNRLFDETGKNCGKSCMQQCSSKQIAQIFKRGSRLPPLFVISRAKIVSSNQL